jgi:hypothetical protein
LKRACEALTRKRDDRYPDPDNPGMMCRDFMIDSITGSECSNIDLESKRPAAGRIQRGRASL